MKYRSDFVTNSSSSSFIVSFKNKQDMEDKRLKMLETYSESIVSKVFSDIEENKMTYKQARDFIKEDIEDTYYYKYRWGFNSAFKDKPSEWFKSREFKKLIKEDVDRILQKFDDRVNHRGIFAVVTYSDHSDIGRQLEGNIMPNQSFVVRQISNH